MSLEYYSFSPIYEWQLSFINWMRSGICECEERAVTGDMRGFSFMCSVNCVFFMMISDVDDIYWSMRIKCV